MLKRFFNFLPNLAQSWIIVILILAVGGVVFTLLLLALNYYNIIGINNINMLLQYVLPLVPAFVYIYLKGEKEEDKEYTIEKTDTGKVNTIVFFALIAIAIFCIGVVTEPLTWWMEMPQSLKTALAAITQNSVWAFVTTVVAAPVLEEYLLRGVIMRGLLKHSRPLRAILWSAAIFAVIHFNAVQAVSAFMAGCFIGWIYWKSHSFWACIYIHMINNGVSYFIYLLNPQLNVDATFKDILAAYGSYAYPAIYATCAIALIVILYYLNKYLPKRGFKEIYE